MYQKHKNLGIVLFLVLAVLISACSTASSKRMGWVCVNDSNELDCSFELFSGQEAEKIKLEEGQTLDIAYEVEVESGELWIGLVDPDDVAVWEVDLSQTVSDTVSVPVEASGNYHMVVEGMDAKGAFNITWDIID